MGLFSRKKNKEKKEKKWKHPLLKVLDVKMETPDSISIGLEKPAESSFNYVAGQYVTIVANINGQEVRRCYSICSDEADPVLRVGVKRVKDGLMSNYLANELKAGDVLAVMAPEGNFTLENGSGNYVGIAAGSGITPILSQIKKVQKSGGKYHLFYGNRDESSTMFKHELDNTNDSILVNYSFTANGDSRFSKDYLTELVQANLELLKSDGFYLCGPQEMIENAQEVLKTFGVPESKIHFELFVVQNNPTVDLDSDTMAFTGVSSGKVVLDGEQFEIQLDGNGDTILDQILDAGYDAPYSCKGAVCSTCRAKVLDGAARLDSNFSLSDKEIEEGYILSCQAHPTTPNITIDYDQG